MYRSGRQQLPSALQRNTSRRCLCSGHMAPTGIEQYWRQCIWRSTTSPAATAGCCPFTRSAGRRYPTRMRTGITPSGSRRRGGLNLYSGPGEQRFPRDTCGDAIKLALGKLADDTRSRSLRPLGKVAEQLRPSFEHSSRSYAGRFRPPRGAEKQRPLLISAFPLAGNTPTSRQEPACREGSIRKLSGLCRGCVVSEWAIRG